MDLAGRRVLPPYLACSRREPLDLAESRRKSLSSRRVLPWRKNKMFLKVQLPWNVIIAAENLDAKGLMLQRAIIIRLLGDFAAKGGCPQGSEAWGPLEMWARLLLMPSYCYEGGESPLFRDNLSKIEKDIVVCFIVIGTM